MIFGYARVSTPSQNLDRQLDALKTIGVLDDRLFVEKISGSTKEFQTIIDHFEKKGVQVVSNKEQIDTRTPDRHASHDGSHGPEPIRARH